MIVPSSVCYYWWQRLKYIVNTYAIRLFVPSPKSNDNLLFPKSRTKSNLYEEDIDNVDPISVQHKPHISSIACIKFDTYRSCDGNNIMSLYDNQNFERL